jgi:cobalt-zinc-cadmium efflux system membrane fusion protein
MYGRAHIDVDDVRSGVVVPRDAVQQAKGVSLAFVRLQDDLYETRRVRVGARSGEHVHLMAGVRAGELVVTEGSFLLKTETLKGSIGAGCCEIDGK